ncbi:hypothetical protein M0802_014945 [Mischocyttarus mexicanus]|nr:hypothetical protein M0802_014945 [Mischocyttarus mexicanus]
MTREADPVEAKQVEHMIKMAHLDKKDITHHFGTVVVKEDERWKLNSERMVEAWDMQFLILIFINRGAVTSKILKKAQEDFVKCFKHLANKYGINTTEDRRRLRSTSLGPNVVTLPRIAACFPILTCSLFNSGYGRIIASKAMYTGDIPEAFFSPMFPSVVSRSVQDGASNLHPQLVLWAKLIDNVIHQRDKPTPLDQIWTYYLASFNSSVVIPEERHALSIKFGVVLDDGTSPPECCDSMLEKFRQIQAAFLKTGSIWFRLGNQRASKRKRKQMLCDGLCKTIILSIESGTLRWMYTKEFKSEFDRVIVVLPKVTKLSVEEDSVFKWVGVGFVTRIKKFKLIAARSFLIKEEDILAYDVAIKMTREADPVKAKQVEHMIKMAHLDKKDITHLFGTVVVKEDERWKLNSERIVDACKYQGFDPGLMAFELIKR